MRDYFVPDRVFGKFDDITPEYLLAAGCRALVIDIDNTLAPYEQAEPDERIRGWFAALERAGIRAALISNNEPERVERFNRELGLIAYPDSHKPSPKNIRAAMARMGTDAAGTVSLGDQLFTDVWAARRAGLRALIVPPIRDKRNLFFRCKRLLERPFMARYRRRGAIM